MIGNVIATHTFVGNGNVHLDTFTIVPVAVWQTHNAWHHLISNLQWRGDGPYTRGDRYFGAFTQTLRSSIARMHHERTAIFAFYQAMIIVHPRVAVTNVPAPDQAEGGGIILFRK